MTLADAPAAAAHYPMVNGLMLIGDPHLASRVPGFRRDDYPNVILGKLRQALALARDQRLAPVILGDLFHVPRDNANWLLTELLVLLAGRDVLAIHGNHDVSEGVSLVGDDSLAVLAAAGAVTLLDGINAVRRFRTPGGILVLGGTPWGAPIPASFARQPDDRHVIWITHHDLNFPGYFGGTSAMAGLPGIDMVINGHIHYPMQPLHRGATMWLNPGNIARIKRGAEEAARVPAVLVVEPTHEGLSTRAEVLQHAPYEEVFHPQEELPEASLETSMFVRGLENLTGYSTCDGSGLVEFLDRNLEKFEPGVAAEIRALAKEVCDGEGK